MGIFGFPEKTADATLAGNLRSIALNQSIEAAQQFYLSKSPTQREIIRNNLSSEEITKYGLNSISLNPSFGGIQTTGDFSPKPDLSLTNTLFPIPQTDFRQYLEAFPGNAANLGLDPRDSLFINPLDRPTSPQDNRSAPIGQRDPNLEVPYFASGVYGPANPEYAGTVSQIGPLNGMNITTVDIYLKTRWKIEIDSVTTSKTGIYTTYKFKDKSTITIRNTDGRVTRTPAPRYNNPINPTTGLPPKGSVTLNKGWRYTVQQGEMRTQDASGSPIVNTHDPGEFVIP